MPNSSTFAVGAYFNSTNGSLSGSVKIFDWKTNSWKQRGQTLLGSSDSDQFGNFVYMADSNTVAIGANLNDDNGNNAGQVQVFTWTGTQWLQKGSNINGDNAEDRVGRCMAMYGTNRICIGAPGDDGFGFNAGAVKILEWNGLSWAQVGSEILGESAYENFGSSVSMPSEKVVASGAYLNDNKTGCVRIFEFKNGDWIQKGNTILGDSTEELCGYSIDMPSENTIVVSSHQNNTFGPASGMVRIFDWNGSQWVQRGSKIFGNDPNGKLGVSVEMPDSLTLAVGAFHNSTTGSYSGDAFVYKWDGAQWKLNWQFHGENSNNRFGRSVNMPNPSTLGIGAPGNWENGSESGQYSVYKLCNSIDSAFSIYQTSSCQIPVELKANNHSIHSYWSTGDTGRMIVVNKSGLYVYSKFSLDGCLTHDSINVSILNHQSSPNHSSICTGSSIDFNHQNHFQTDPCSPLGSSISKNQIAWWPFCQNIDNKSGLLLETIDLNNTLFSPDRYSNSNSALSFNGNNSVIINANSNLDFGIKDSYSISCWVSIDSLNNDQSLIEKWNDRADTPYPFRLRISNGYIGIGRYTSRTGLMEDSTTTQACGFKLSSIGPKTYFHVVSVYTPDTIFLYINDTLRSFRKNYLDPTKDVKNNLPLYFGQRGNNIKFFYGYLDDIGVWNRALTKEEISYLYTIGDKKTLPITWSTGDTSSQITVSPVFDTQYWVSVSDGTTTCYDTCMVRVSNPKSTVLADSISCFGLQDGSANLSTSGGIAPYAIQWSTGDTTSLLSNLIAGTYAAVVTDSIGCTDSVSIQLTEPSLLQLSVVNIDSVNCFNGFDGSASVRAEGGNTGGYTFLWNDPDLQTDSLAIGLAFGQYKVRVLDTKGCSDSLTIDVGQPALLQLSLLHSQDPSCYNYADGFISTSATGGTPGYTFIWNLSPDPGTDSVASLPSGDYWVYVQDKNGCLDSLNKELINPDQIVVKIQDPIRSIKGLPITLNADVSPSNNYQYTWSPSATFQDQSSEQNPTISLDADQGVRLVVVDSNGCIGQDSTTARVLQGAGIIFPNSFSPNDDGRNDVFKPHQYFDLLDLKIYNAWGQCIYQSNGSKDGWDGTFAGEKVPAGAYVYQMKVQLIGTNQITSQSGSVTLVR